MKAEISVPADQGIHSEQLVKRTRMLNRKTPGAGPVAYWMSRDQRVHDNWALLAAQELAIERWQPLIVVFNLVSKFMGATIRQYDFMLRGLEEAERTLAQYGIPMILATGEASRVLPVLIRRLGISALVVDFSSLREPRRWREEVANSIDIPFYETDAHNVIPCWLLSDKQEFAAYTMRPKIHRLLGEFLCEIPRLRKHPFKWNGELDRIDWQRARQSLRIDLSVPVVNQFQPGESAAAAALGTFTHVRLEDYHELRNDPSENHQSDLSPYLHFGQLSAQRVALAVQRFDQAIKSQEAFLEELIVRRELAENFCYHNAAYDSVDGFPNWARQTLEQHAQDPRTYLYSRDQLENAETHDELWNAAQTEMVSTGKMHGYLRMYWAKKLLEWTPHAEDALAIGIYLNDKYELDGRDPNGYVGVAWSVGGVHDRAFGEREIYGKIRYMSHAGCRRKFDIAAYANRVAQVSLEAGA